MLIYLYDLIVICTAERADVLQQLFVNSPSPSHDKICSKFIILALFLFYLRYIYIFWRVGWGGVILFCHFKIDFC